jgi:hypothetical protein
MSAVILLKVSYVLSAAIVQSVCQQSYNKKILVFSCVLSAVIRQSVSHSVSQYVSSHLADRFLVLSVTIAQSVSQQSFDR